MDDKLNVNNTRITRSCSLKTLYVLPIWNRVTGLGSPGHRVSDFGRDGSDRGSVCQTRCGPVFDPVLSFNVRVYRGVASTE